jgi:hypothetical protein
MLPDCNKTAFVKMPRYVVLEDASRSNRPVTTI